MILVTGGTGFIGKALVRNLVQSGYPVRMLIRPSPHSPDLPRGVPVEVALSTLDDERSLRAAMKGVDAVYHLAGVERRGAYADLMSVDIQGSRMVAQAAADAGVDRIFYLSHLGADRASAFPVLKAKAIAEEYIRRNRIHYTIFRTAIVYGPNDGFTTALARLFSVVPYFFFIPGNGRTLIQPLWVEDLVTCLTWALEDNSTRDQIFETGGPEYFTFLQVAEMIMHACNLPRKLVPVRPPYLRGMTVFLESLFPSLPVSVYWLDYLAVNRTCALDTLPRLFSLMPARMSQRLGYLRGENWRLSMLRDLGRALLRRTAR